MHMQKNVQSFQKVTPLHNNEGLHKGVLFYANKDLYQQEF